jgi:general secretion pathway protein D
LPDARELEYWSGTEATLRSSPLVMKPLGAVSLDPAGKTAMQQLLPVGPASVPLPTPSVMPLVFSWQGPSQASVGDKISLRFNTRSEQGVNTLGFLVGFDPAVLKATDVSEGSFMQQDSQPTNFTRTIDQASGQILIDLKGSVAGGEGSVVEITFEVAAASPQSPVTVSRIDLAGSDGTSLPFTPPAPHFIAVSP